MVRKNDQILGGLESEVCSWRTIMTLIGGLVALEWKMGMEKKKREEILAGGQSCAKRRKKEPFSLARKPPPKDFEKKKSLRAEASFSLAMTLSLQRPLYLTDREE